MKIDLPTKFIVNTQEEIDLISPILAKIIPDAKVVIVGNNGFFVCMLCDEICDVVVNAQYVEQLKKEFKLEENTSV